MTGRDLIAAGYQPSPQFKPMLALAEDAQLEGAVTTREQALALVESPFHVDPAAKSSMTSALHKLRWSIQHRGVGRTLQAAAKSLGRKLDPPGSVRLTHSTWNMAPIPAA